jgi:ABC-type sugar transport system ATPase subunit
MESALIDMQGICKAFPGVRALNNVDFSVQPGEVVGLLGENGAGKSTLMKVLAGVYKQEAGKVLWQGQATRFHTIQDANQAGISLIFQELNNCPNLKPLDNLFLGRERFLKGLPFLDYSAMRAKALELFAYLGVQVDLDREIGSMSTAVQQMIEIAKALLTDVKLLIMDEPTSSLSDKETAQLFKVIRELKARGISVIFISHKLNEVFEITDRIVVLRDGENAGEINPRTGTMDQLINLMVGRELSTLFTRRTGSGIGGEVLRVEGITGAPRVLDVSFSLNKGEILGVAGLIGAGRTEMARMIIGADPKTRGKVFIEGKLVRIKSPRDAVRAGIAYLPEDRKTQALILPMTVRENLTMSIHSLVLRLGTFLSRAKENAVTDAYVSALDIKISDREQVVNNLSGGNQQKVVIAKWLATKPRILILDEPTRGIDVAAKAEVHRMIGSLADQGVSILLISSELPEVLSLADRVLVMHEGRVKAILAQSEATQETIMNAALVTEVQEVSA